MEVSDIVGLKDPLIKLIEVVSAGVGACTKPYFTRKNADAKAYEIRTIASAMRDVGQGLDEISYEDGSTNAKMLSKSSGSLIEEDSALEVRADKRNRFQELQRQLNIENITQCAAEEMSMGEKIDAKPPSEEWVTRFFRIAEDVSSEKMQKLWGKILAGEVKKSGTYSLRTMEILRNISQNEAELFVRFSRIAFQTADKIFVPNDDHEKSINELSQLSFLDLLLLREIGLLFATDLEFSLAPTELAQESTFFCGSTVLFVSRPAGAPKHPIPVIVFSEIGKQLFSLIDHEPASARCIERFATMFRGQGVVVKAATLLSKKGSKFTYSDPKVVSPGTEIE